MSQSNYFKKYIGKPDKKRFISAMKREPIDRVPNFEVLIEDKHVEKILGRHAGNTASYDSSPSKGSLEETDNAKINPMNPKDYLEVCDVIGQDIMLLHTNIWIPFKVEDKNGNLINISPHSIKNRKDFEKIVIDSDTQINNLISQIKKYKEAIKKKDSSIGIAVGPGILLQTLYEILVGINDFMIMCYEDRSLVEDMLDAEMEHCIKTTNALLKEEIDVFFPADDIAFKTGLFLPPKLMREIWIPRMAVLLEPVVNAGVPIIFHSDGNIDEIIEDLIEIGINCIHPLDPYGVSYKEYKKKYGNNLSFAGNIDIEFPLAKGTSEDIKKDVKEHLDVMMPGGGYILSSSHSIVNYIPFENFAAMINAAHEYGNY